MAGRWFVSIILLFVILLLMLPSRDEQTLSRIGSASMLACTKVLRDEVLEQLRNDQPVTARFNNTCPELITSLELDSEGSMVIRGNKHQLTMWLSPVFDNSQPRWTCQGEPAEFITKLCVPLGKPE